MFNKKTKREELIKKYFKPDMIHVDTIRNGEGLYVKMVSRGLLVQFCMQFDFTVNYTCNSKYCVLDLNTKEHLAEGNISCTSLINTLIQIKIILNNIFSVRNHHKDEEYVI